MLKVLKQCSVSKSFSTLAYKRIKNKTVKKCYTEMFYCSLTNKFKRLKLKCISRIGYVLNSFMHSPTQAVKISSEYEHSNQAQRITGEILDNFKIYLYGKY